MMTGEPAKGETNHKKQSESKWKKIRLVDFATMTLTMHLQSPELKGFSVGTELIELVEQP